MFNDTLIEKVNLLPDCLKSDVSLFVDFLLFKSNKELTKLPRKPGFLKGKISITDDFDEPLEEFREYM